MKNILTLFLFFSMVVPSQGQFLIRKVIKSQKASEQEKSQTASHPLDSAVYKSYHHVKYADLPDEVKMLMDSLKCGKIDAVPSDQNDHKTNMDYGYSIDLNDDGEPEYVFCCLRFQHGPCNANIFARLNGRWSQIAGNFDGYSNEDPMMNIQVLKTRHEGFHDLFQNQQVMVFGGGVYGGR